MDLKSLWKTRAEAILHVAAAGETDYREVANLAAQIGADYHGRFLIELIQNAEDQAIAANLTASKVTVVRTKRLVAVANHGLPFTEKGIKEITSVGISSKDPTVNIGNKGVGFKAVFQVTSEPEIYSAANRNGSFCDPDGPKFRMVPDPFADSVLLAALREHLQSLTTADPVLDRKLQNRFGTAAPFDGIVAELKAAASFKFPLPLLQAGLDARLRELDLPPGFSASAQTLVVLPTIQDDRTQQVVTKALNDLRERAGSILLFLNGIERIEICDRCSQDTVEVVREPVGPAECVSGIRFQKVKTYVTRADVAKIDDRTAIHLLASHTIGRGGNSEDASTEEATLKAAAESVPGSNWKDFHTATVTVAFPLPKETDTSLSVPPADGLFFIGLPTHDLTGTPASVSAPFHGTISRTGLNLEEPINDLLFQQAVTVFWAGVQRLQMDTDRRLRRHSTLMFNTVNGPLAQRLTSGDGLQKQRIVLAEDGLQFIPPGELVMPAQKDVELFAQVRPLVENASQYGFRLPDLALMKVAYELLALLADGPARAEAAKDTYLKRHDGGMSFIETVATRGRMAGTAFWEEYLGWLIARFLPGELDDQVFLPVTGSASLSAPNSRVFIKPLAGGVEAARPEDEEPTEAIPDEILDSLRFLDESCVTVRAEQRTYTELARKLAPADYHGLVRSPRTSDLLNYALSPRLKELATRSDQFLLVVQLLYQAHRWLSSMNEPSRNLVKDDAFVVPVKTDTGEIIWVSSRNVYFGAGWLKGNEDQLLEQAYGHDPKRRLMPWNEFQARLADLPIDREEWEAAMRSIGVASHPRILEASKRRVAPWVAARGYQLSVNYMGCPLEGCSPYWLEYQQLVAKDRRTATASGQPYDVESLCWIDGLENDQAREAVVALMLDRPDPYQSKMMTDLCRRDTGTDRSRIESFWMFALRQKAWPVIPTNKGPKSAESCWFLSEHERSQEFTLRGIVASVESKHANALLLLRGMGVTSLESAPSRRLVAALHETAAELARGLPGTSRAISSLVHTLYSRLQDRCDQEGEAATRTTIQALVSRHVPLEIGGTLHAVDMLQIPRIYIKDDPVRARLISDIDVSAVVPLAAREASRALFNGLGAILGSDRILRTSKAPVETGFVADATQPTVLLLGFLENAFPENEVASDLGVLYAFGKPGERSVNPSDDRFKEVWSQVTKTCLQFGSFADRVSHRSAFDAFAPKGPVLQVVQQASPYEILQACWPILGLGYRDILAAYATALEKASLSMFFADRGIGPGERDQVDAVVGRKAGLALERLKPILFAVWRRHSLVRDVATFLAEWQIHATTTERAEVWLGLENLQGLVNMARELSRPEDYLPVLDRAGTTVGEWRLARRDLGLEHATFQSTISLYAQTRDQVVAVFKALAARSPSAQLEAAKDSLTRLAALDCPFDLSCEPPSNVTVLNRLVADVQAALEHAPQTPLPSSWKRKLSEWYTLQSTSLDQMLRDDPPRRDVEEYLDRTEIVRSTHAKEIVWGVLRVAAALGTSLGETLNPAVIGLTARVSMLSAGWWANRFSVLLPLREEIESRAPLTARRLSDARVFRDPCPYVELLEKFPELQKEAEDGKRIQKALPKEVLFGVTGTLDELGQDLQHGHSGKLGQFIRQCAESPVGLAQLAAVDRKTLPPIIAHRGGRGGRGGHSIPGNYNPTIMEWNGRIGEAFVYETFHRLLEPGFDSTCWLSGNRCAYGFDGQGDDTLGYDLDYWDREGKLSPSTRERHCLIEVKATEGDGTAPFPISEPEWRKAVEVHEANDQRIYVIVRVRHVRTKPEIFDIIIDPVRFWHAGSLQLINKDLWVRVG